MSSDVVVFEENFYDVYIKASSPTAVGQIKGIRLVYDLSNRTDVKQLLNDSQTGTTFLHLGSVYLPAGTLQVGSSAVMGTDNVAGTATLEIRRFTGGAVVGSITATGASLQVVSPTSNLAVPYPDFYDLYLKASGVGITAMIKGINLVVIG
jgi:hypothetical protein